MICLTCNAERITNGSSKVLPALRSRLPLSKLRPIAQYAAMPAIILMTGYLAFADPRSMSFIVLAWILTAHRLGRTEHCPPGKARQKRRKRHKSDAQAITRYEATYLPSQDPQDGPDRLQRDQERQDTSVVPDTRTPQNESELIR